MKKMFRVEIDATMTTWETCEAYVEAETEEEARKLFEEDPWEVDWDGWDVHDSEMRHWEIQCVELDQGMTDELNYKEKNDADVQSNS